MVAQLPADFFAVALAISPAFVTASAAALSGGAAAKVPLLDTREKLADAWTAAHAESWSAVRAEREQLAAGGSCCSGSDGELRAAGVVLTSDAGRLQYGAPHVHSTYRHTRLLLARQARLTSRDPTLGIARVFIYALRRIERGEELTYDYSFSADEKLVPCRCGAAACRGSLNVV